MEIFSIIVFISTLISIWEVAFSAQFYQDLPYPPGAALFGPKNKFICNAVIIGQGRVLTTADCLKFDHNGTYKFGQPQDFHVAIETNNIEWFENGTAFSEPARSKILSKLLRKRLPTYDNKYSNDVYSNRFASNELRYLMKSLRGSNLEPKLSNNYVSVKSFTIHPRFQGNFSNDLAILEVTPMRPLSNASVVGKYNLDIGGSYNRIVDVHGWGIVSTRANEANRNTSYQVRTIKMLLVPPIQCKQIIGPDFDLYQHLCLLPVTNETICFGFTGAPIVLDNELVGVIEFGEASCDTQHPVVGIRLGAFRRFLGIPPTSIFARIREAIRRILHPIRIFPM